MLISIHNSQKKKKKKKKKKKETLKNYGGKKKTQGSGRFKQIKRQKNRVDK